MKLENGLEVVPVSEFKFQNYDSSVDNGSTAPASVYLTCTNHQNLRWITKNPYQRSIHYVGLAESVEITKENGKYMWQECDCLFANLVVIVEEKE
jgi:hypothetical protein